MVSVSLSNVTLMDLLLHSQTLSMGRLLKVATRQVKPGMESSDKFRLVTRSVGLIHVAFISANYQTSTHFSVGKLTRLTPCYGHLSWTNSERLSWVFSFSMLKQRSGDRHILKVHTFSPSSSTRTKLKISSHLNSLRVRMISVFTLTRRTWWLKEKSLSLSSF